METDVEEGKYEFRPVIDLEWDGLCQTIRTQDTMHM